MTATPQLFLTQVQASRPLTSTALNTPACRGKKRISATIPLRTCESSCVWRLKGFVLSSNLTCILGNDRSNRSKACPRHAQEPVLPNQILSHVIPYHLVRLREIQGRDPWDRFAF